MNWTSALLKRQSDSGSTGLQRWLGCPVVRALGLRLDGRALDFRPTRLVLGWVIVFGQTNHLSISPSHPDQLSLLPSAGREVSTSQSAVTFCGWTVRPNSITLSSLRPAREQDSVMECRDSLSKSATGRKPGLRPGLRPG